jgi:NhaA family Na+:H+ antiporter
MSRDQAAPTPAIPLPEQPVRRLVEPIARFLRIEAASGVVLLVATVAAFALANSPWSGPFLDFWSTPIGVRIGSREIAHSLRHAINDGLMTLFFFVVGLEIKRELVLGELRDPRAAALPLAAAAGGMAVPAGLYLALQLGEPGERGWGVVMATDIAFVVGCLAVLGRRVPHGLRIFVLSLAIIDDIGAILVIAVGYAGRLDLAALALGAFGVSAVYGLRRLGVRSIPVFVVAGVLVWFAVHESGIHATISGVILGLLTPARPWVEAPRLRTILRRVGDYLHGNGWREAAGAGGGAGEPGQQALLRSVAFAARETLSPLERLESALHPWVGFAIMPLFALANVGVPLGATGLADPVAAAVIVGLVLGKPIGIVGACAIAVRLRLAVLPAGLGWRVVAAAGVLAGIGFTMSLFIANLAFDGPALDAAKLGIVAASVIAAVAGMTLLFVALGRDPSAGRAS